MSKVHFLVCVLAMTASCAPAARYDAKAAETVRVLMVTQLGDIEIEVYPRRAPASAANFLEYVDRGYYAGAAFYRTVNPDNDNGLPRISIIQGGLIDGTAPLPPIVHETTRETGIRHSDGVTSLARGAPGTGSAATFFICLGDQPSLDFGGTRFPDGLGFAAFGKVVRGMAVVGAIHARDAGGDSDSPYVQGQMLTEPVTILSAARIPR